MRYEYKVIAGEIGNTGGRGTMPDPHSLTVHHSAVIRNGSEDPKTVAASYCKYHGGYMPYHFLIPYNDDNNIYVTQYVSQYTWHNANGTGNKDSLAICIDGNFQEQQPKETQLKKFKQLLDDFNSDWFKQNGWSSALDGIRPKQKDVWTYSDNKKVFTLHWHNEVAQIGHGTACCGKNLMPYVSEYRDKAGNVSWGQPVTPPVTPPPTDPCAGIKAENENLKQQVANLSAELSRVQQQLSTTALELANAKGQVEILNGNVEALESSLEALKISSDNDIKKLEQDLLREENKNKLLKEQNEALEINNTNQSKLIEDLETKVENQRVTIVRLEKKLENCETSMTNAIQTLIKKMSDFIINLFTKK